MFKCITEIINWMTLLDQNNPNSNIRSITLISKDFEIFGSAKIGACMSFSLRDTNTFSYFSPHFKPTFLFNNFIKRFCQGTKFIHKSSIKTISHEIFLNHLHFLVLALLDCFHLFFININSFEAHHKIQ